MDERFKTILQKTFDLFAKFGIRSISMDDICREMGISKKTLYTYVSSKEDLINKLLEGQRIKQNEAILCVESKELNAIDSLLEVSKTLHKKLVKVNPTMAYDLVKYYPEIFKKHSIDKRKILSKRIKSNISKGIEEGYYRSDLDIDLIAQLYLKKLEDIFDPEFWVNEKYSFDKIFKTMFVNHIRGISNQKGIDYLEQQQKLLNFKID